MRFENEIFISGYTCPLGWTAVGYRCLHAQDQNRDPVTWDEAEAICAEVGAKMAKFYSGTGDRYPFNEMKRSHKGFWLGLSSKYLLERLNVPFHGIVLLIGYHRRKLLANFNPLTN